MATLPRKARQLVRLDGRTLEGGGQLLRIALCLSALTGTPVQIDHIRGARPSGGGLKAQHLTCVKWLALACNAKTTGAKKGSTTLLFEPGDLQGALSPAYTKFSEPDELEAYQSIVDIGTAGSTGLVLQAILPYILFSPPKAATPIRFRLGISGGTNVSASPSFEYITQVLLPTLESIGLPSIKTTLISRGWSQGKATTGSFLLDFTISKPAVLLPFNLRLPHIDPPAADTTRGAQLQATFLGPKHIHQYLQEKLSSEVCRVFGAVYAEDGKLSTVCEDSRDEKRLYLIIVATVVADGRQYKLGHDWLYDKKVRVIDRAIQELCKRVVSGIHAEVVSGACVDEHMRDQLVIFEALANGTSSLWPGLDKDNNNQPREPSLHAQTAEWVSKQMLGADFAADGGCKGVGLNAGLADQLAGLQI